MHKRGVKLEDLLISQRTNGEQERSDRGQPDRSGAIDLLVIDSVAALTPKN